MFALEKNEIITGLQISRVPKIFQTFNKEKEKIKWKKLKTFKVDSKTIARDWIDI